MADSANPDSLNFEDFAHKNGEVHWYAREFMGMLGYADYSSFRKRVVERAIAACLTLQIPVAENFRDTVTTDANGNERPDLNLTRFACYLISMNGDPRKTEVAAAQAYFAGLAEAFREYLEGREEVERLVVRGELGEQEKSLASTANSHGVTNYAFFQNAGYRGMYNMNLTQVRTLKGVPSGRSPLDFMGSTELAANLFRITQTEEKIRNEGIQGQGPLEDAAKTVGKAVRRTMQELSGTRPEQLPPAEDIKEVAKGLKATSREFKKMDTIADPKSN